MHLYRFTPKNIGIQVSRSKGAETFEVPHFFYKLLFNRFTTFLFNSEKKKVETKNKSESVATLRVSKKKEKKIPAFGCHMFLTISGSLDQKVLHPCQGE